MYTEFFCGIGGFACCVNQGERAMREEPGDVPWSIDINQNALAVHQRNHDGRLYCRTIESLTADFLEMAPRQFWWMSPPCQPFTGRGKQRDLDDPRSAGFKNMLTLIGQLQPQQIGIENVPEFSGSVSQQRLCEALEQSGYQIAEYIFCPSDFGYLNRRRRYYLIAAKTSLRPETMPRSTNCESSLPSENTIGLPAITPRLEIGNQDSSLAVPNAWLAKFPKAIHIIDQSDFLAGQATTNCFTSAYGRSPVRSGSYLRMDCGRVRFFSPQEILWQLGFPDHFRLTELPNRKLWPLVGNSLSLPCVQRVLSRLPIQIGAGIPNQSPEPMPPANRPPVH